MKNSSPSSRVKYPLKRATTAASYPRTSRNTSRTVPLPYDLNPIFLLSPIQPRPNHSPLQIEEKPGHQEVVLRRTFNDEKISITITTADVTANENGDEGQDSAMYDEDVDDIIGQQSGGASTKGAINQGKTPDGNFRVAPEDKIAPADRDELNDEMNYNEEQGFPAHASIRIERPGKGALAIEAIVQDGDLLIEDLGYFPAADLADPQTAEKDWQRRAVYTGPPFGNLDEDLQFLMEKYLEERGIDTRFALFVPDYLDWKEQKEYVRWLNSKS
jgi:complement component 1 Q subcomponent-binding protein, mitochondrial